MPLKNKSLTVTYTAWDTVAQDGAVGDSANHTLRAVGDGTEFTPAATPAQVDAVNLKGVYKLTLTAGEMNYDFVTLGGLSSTTGVRIIPVSIPTEGGTLPHVAPGTAGGLPTVDASNKLAGIVGDTPQTGDSFARLGVPAGASVAADVAAIKADTGAMATATAGLVTRATVGAGSTATLLKLTAAAGYALSAVADAYKDGLVKLVDSTVASTVGTFATVAGYDATATPPALTLSGTGLPAAPQVGDTVEIL